MMKTKMEFIVEGNNKSEVEDIAKKIISEYLEVPVSEVLSLVDVEMIIKFGPRDLDFLAEVFVRVK